MMTIRVEQPGDAAGIRDVNQRAFNQPTEAAIVDELRRTCPERLSAFMVLVLDADTMRGVSGVARYREEFDRAV